MAIIKDLVQGKVLKPLEIVVVKKGGFKSYMEKHWKIGWSKQTSSPF